MLYTSVVVAWARESFPITHSTHCTAFFAFGFGRYTSPECKADPPLTCQCEEQILPRNIAQSWRRAKDRDGLDVLSQQLAGMLHQKIDDPLSVRCAENRLELVGSFGKGDARPVGVHYMSSLLTRSPRSFDHNV